MAPDAQWVTRQSGARGGYRERVLAGQLAYIPLPHLRVSISQEISTQKWGEDIIGRFFLSKCISFLQKIITQKGLHPKIIFKNASAVKCGNTV
jgi:hypothetical protein